MYYQQNQDQQEQQYQQQQYYQQNYNNYQQMDQYYDTKNNDTQNNYDFDLGDFSDKAIRTNFVKKVYTLLTCELLITIGLIALSLYTNFQKCLIQRQGNNIIVFQPFGQPTVYEYYEITYTWFFWTSMILAFMLQCALYCGNGIARKVPANYFVTFFYLLFFGCFLSGICDLIAFYCGTIVIWAAWGITGGIVFALTCYACFTSQDITMKIGAIFIMIPALLMLCMMTIFWYSEFLYIFICTLFIIFYGFFLVWETQMILGKGKIKFSIDDYLIASLMLYGTIIQMFMRILEIIAIARGGR